ncbi:hypothetical protein ACROYT_G018836 [Oculina patagonica]
MKRVRVDQGSLQVKVAAMIRASLLTQTLQTILISMNYTPKNHPLAALLIKNRRRLGRGQDGGIVVFFEAPSTVAVKALLQPMSANLFKRKVRSPSDVYANIPEEKRTRDHTESEYSERRDEALGRPRAMAAEIATKMDLVLSKLDNIESRLNSVCSSVANIEEALTNIEKDVADLKVKTEGNKTNVSQLKERVDFNEGDIAEAKRDAAAVKLEAEKLKMNLLYFETYNRRENLKFFGIEENTSNVAEDIGDANMDGSPHMTEDTKQASHVQLSGARVEDQQR